MFPEVSMWYVTNKSSPKPAEATVECREDEQGEEACERDGRDDLLLSDTRAHPLTHGPRMYA